MAQLCQDFSEFGKHNAAILVVGPEDARAFARYWREHDLPFIGLPDPEHTVLNLYGQETKLVKFGRLPAQILVDKAGKARSIHYGQDMTDISSNSEMLALMDEVNAG